MTRDSTLLTEIEKAYLAGFFDGEGCINISIISHPNRTTPQHRLQVVLTQTNHDFLASWRNKLNLGKIYESKINEYGNNLQGGPFKRSWQWRIHCKQGEQFLRIILPYLDIKKQQAEIALKFRDTKDVPYRRGGTPRSVIDLRETYKEMLHALKWESAEIDQAVSICETQTGSETQLELPFGLP